MIDVEGPHLLWLVPGQVVLGGEGKQAEQATKNKAVNSIPLWMASVPPLPVSALFDFLA